ncbi:hypothetical protein Q3G72_020847 [Acer saccharum]|nr:hypothetical protein Q3G72_020847 [Acer saccharum]
MKLGFVRKPDAPIEAVAEDVERDDKDDDQEGILTGIPIRNASAFRPVFHIVPNYALTLIIPPRDYDVYYPVKGEVPIHVVAFECAVRLPLHPTLCRILVALGLAPLQISPRFWKHLLGFLVLWREQCKMDNIAREQGFDEFRYVFQVTAIKAEPKGYFYL